GCCSSSRTASAGRADGPVAPARTGRPHGPMAPGDPGCHNLTSRQAALPRARWARPRLTSSPHHVVAADRGLALHIAYTPEQEKLRSELRAYYADLLDPDTRAALAADGQGPVMREVVKRMGSDGWLGVGWPSEYGGKGLGHVEQFVFFDESMRAGAPV